jgi:hypothetical protein
MNSTSRTYREAAARRAELTTLELSRAIRTLADYEAFLASLRRAERNIWFEVLPVPETR